MARGNSPVTGAALGLLLLIGGVAGFLFLESTDRKRPEFQAAWSQIHLPVLVWLVGAGAAIGADPYLGALINARPVGPRHSFSHLWPVLGLPVLVACAALCVQLFRPDAERRGAPWMWFATSAGTLLLVLAERVRLLDAQLLMLGALTIVWWRSASLDHAARRQAQSTDPHAAPRLSLAAVGALPCSLLAALGAGFAAAHFSAPVLSVLLAGTCAALMLGSLMTGSDASWAVLLGVCGGIGTAALARIGFVAAAGIADSQRTASGSWFEALTSSLQATPYLTGLSVYAPEAVLLLAGAGVYAVDSLGRPGRIGRRWLAALLAGATALTLGSRLGVI